MSKKSNNKDTEWRIKRSNRRILIFNLFLLLICFLAFTGLKKEDESPLIISVRDFGVTPQSENVYHGLKSALESAMKVGKPVEIRFERDAVYRISLPDSSVKSNYAFHITGADHLVINGQGATLVINDPELGGICTENCTNTEIKNIFVDYDPLPYAYGTITSVNIPENWFELQVAPGFMEPDQPCFDHAKGKWGLTIRDEADGGRRYGPTAVFASHWEKTGNRLWKFHVAEKRARDHGLLARSAMNPGESYIHLARNYVQAVAAIHCDYTLWENIVVYASPGLAFFPFTTSHHIIRNCHVKVKEGRVFSTNADGIHMRGSRGNVLIENCSFEGMGDDAINVHSTAMSIQGQPSQNQVLVRKSTYTVHPGDSLVLVHSQTGEVGETVKVVEVHDSGRNWMITLNHSLSPLKVGTGFEHSDNLYNLSEAANPFVIRNCRFNDYRGRGILVSARGGSIENNIFRLREGWSVVLNYESTRWGEGPIGHNVTIRNNTFYGNNSMPGAILSILYARDNDTDKPTTSAGRPFRNLKIEGNRFYEYGKPVIKLNNARFVSMHDNRIQCSGKAIRPYDQYASIVLQNCGDVAIDSLWISDQNEQLYAAVDIGKDCSPGNSISVKNLHADVCANCSEVRDERIHSRFYGDPKKLAAYEFFTRGMGKGRAVILTPEQVSVAETVPEAKILYTVDEKIAPGGSVRLWCPNGATNPQLTNPSDPGFMQVTTQNVPFKIELDRLSFRKMYNQKDTDGYRFVVVNLPEGLPRGGEIFFRWMNVTVDKRAGRYGGDSWLFQIAVDHDADGSAELIKDSPMIPKRPGEAEYLLARISSSGVTGKPVRLNVCAFDEFNNPAILYESRISVTCEKEGVQIPKEVKITRNDLGTVQCELTFRDTGFYWITVRSEDGLVAESNPVEIFKTDPGEKLYWGDLHVHTEMSADARAGAHTVSSYGGSYNIGRFQYALDFQANSDHHGLDQGNYGPDEWENMQKITNAANEEGKFVTLIACELSGHKGDQIVYFDGDHVPFLSHSPADPDCREKDWQELGQAECFFVPHHVCQGMRPWDWNYQDSIRIPLCEIFSNHGRCEFSGNEPFYSPHKEPVISGQTWVDQLNAGQKLGAIANSDDHWARPGACGLTGAWASDLTRKDIYSALEKRQCYGSTGARAILHFTTDGQKMGEEIECSKPPRFKVRAAAPGLIEKIEIISEGEPVYSSEPTSRMVDIDWQVSILKDTYYYVRLTLAAEENTEASMRNKQQFVWSSPIWVKVKNRVD